MEEKLDPIEKIALEQIWCAAANIKKEISFGEENILRKGTKHFRGGAKVYIAYAYGGMCENATVIGHHRRNGRYVKITLPVNRLENFRLELVYSPKVIELLTETSEECFIEHTKEYAEYLIMIIPEWIEENHKK